MEEGIKRACKVAEIAIGENLKVRGYISCVIHCRYEGKIKPEIVTRIAEQLLSSGCFEISLGDTTGTAGAGSVRNLLRSLISSGLPINQLAAHFHDTYGQGLANIIVAIEEGVRAADSSVAGLGGCPYSEGASGNISTEDLVYMLHDLGFETGINLEKLIEVSGWISRKLKRNNHSKVAVAYFSRSENHE